jgi:hypothetical protein
MATTIRPDPLDRRTGRTVSLFALAASDDPPYILDRWFPSAF